MNLTLSSAPALEPISLTEAKAHLRVDGTDHDTLIGALIKSARQYIEEITGRALITQTWDGYLDQFPCQSAIELPCAPLQSVTGVYYTPDGGAEATLAAGNYLVDTHSEPGRIVLTTAGAWPGDSLQPVNGVRVRFMAGYGNAGSNVPEPLRQAMLLLIGQWYDNPNTYEVGPVMATPFAVQALLAPYRMWS